MGKVSAVKKPVYHCPGRGEGSARDHGSSLVQTSKARTYDGLRSPRDPRRPECLPRRLGREEVRCLTHPASSLASMTASQKEKTAFQSQSEPISDASTSLRTQRCSANAGHTATAWAPLRTPGAFPP
ncbi:hypothetical protein SFRURICE_015818 [Spodoptera frugiperda]|nr:hypothetical protein SFRURICE_015818 [Spodoptera frugiperda]